MTKEEIEVLSAIDLDEYYVDKIVAHEENGRNPMNWKFKVRWVVYEPEDDSWLYLLVCGERPCCFGL